MKRTLIFLLLVSNFVQAQLTPTPDSLWGQLFKDVQLSKALGDNKTFVDCVPKYEPSVVLSKYAQQKKSRSFDLKKFVLDNFELPASPDVKVTPGLSLRQHLTELWNVLTRQKDTVQKWSSLLPLPGSYIVPGGRFREIYYWDSYFTMQGLAVSKRYDLIEDMVDNFAYLIMHYGHIPNGNRNYYLGRSQPPYFALMVELLHEHEGDTVYKKYYPALEKEYAFWMQGADTLTRLNTWRRVVKLPDGSVLNRNWDDVNAPRQESYAEDLATARVYKNGDGMVFRNLRGGAESGLDFSSRWFADTMHLGTIETTDLVSIDLNCLLYSYEHVLSRAARVNGAEEKSTAYRRKAQERKAAIIKYCWDANAGYFFDYNLRKGKRTGRWNLAGVMPLFCGIANADQGNAIKKVIVEKFLKPGGVVTSVFNTGEQWDAPNGWAPLQYITVKGLMNYHYDSLAENIALRWMHLNEKVFANTGKMLEKYNVENVDLKSGGGEYPTQDGFGWTNGVYLAFYRMFKE